MTEQERQIEIITGRLNAHLIVIITLLRSAPNKTQLLKGFRKSRTTVQDLLLAQTVSDQMLEALAKECDLIERELDG